MSSTDTLVLTRLTAVALVELLARGDVSASEVVEAQIARIEAVNPALNAVVAARYDAARAEARAADAQRGRGERLGPLHGVPITIKDSIDVAGLPSTYGLPSRATHRAERDDAYVALLRSAGAIVLGKTNVPQLLLYIESDNPLYGRSNNPWDLARTPGGSSGGQAAIVAAGGSALGLGSDTGGSIRIPAAFCGIVGFKPTAGRLPFVASYGMPVGQRAIMSQIGVLARSVDDVALSVDVLNGGRAPQVEPPRPLGDSTSVDVAGLRVAYYTDDGTLSVAPAVRRAVIEAAGMLAGLGAQVVEWRPPDAQQALAIFYGVLSADGGQIARRLLAGNPRDARVSRVVRAAGYPRATLRLLTSSMRLLGQRSTATTLDALGHSDTLHYWGQVEAQQVYAARFAQALDTDDGGPFDVIICPAYPVPALPHGASRDLSVGSYAALYNVLGYPAGVVPITCVRPGEESLRRRSRDAVERAAQRTEVGSAGLPIGVQVVARPWREHVALAAMRAIEAAASQREDYPAAPPL